MTRAALSALLAGLLCSNAFAQGANADSPPTGASLPVGDAAPPPVVRDNLADRQFDATRMAQARELLAEEHGGMRMASFTTHLAELTSGSGGGYRWNAEGWYGGDLHRFVFKTEGEGLRREGLGSAEAQALYSRAVGRYTDVQIGVRGDLEHEGRAYAALAVESLLPYWFHIDASLFVSDRGDVLARLEGSHDLQLTQRLVLQPRAELSFAAQDVRDAGTGSGLSTADLGLRLRYEIRRELAPYIGVSYETDVGRTADFTRAAGERVSDLSVVLGLRAWF